MRSFALILLLAAAAPAAAQIYRCDSAGRTTYQDAPCAGGGVGRQVDTSNTALAPQAVDYAALGALRSRQAAEARAAAASRAAARERAAAEAEASWRAAELRSRQDQAAALADIAEQLRLARLDQIGAPSYVAPPRTPLRPR